MMVCHGLSPGRRRPRRYGAVPTLWGHPGSTPGYCRCPRERRPCVRGHRTHVAIGRILYERRLAAEFTRQALAVIRRDPDVQPHLFLNDRVYVERHHPMTEAYAEDDGIGYEVVTAFEPLLTDDPHKILVLGAPGRLEALSSAVRQAKLSARAVQSEPTKLEFLPPGISKGTALRAMLEALGVGVGEVVAVGDNWNDLEMIEAAGLGVAMADAPEEVRARADHVCGTADAEGFRDVLERFVL